MSKEDLEFADKVAIAAMQAMINGNQHGPTNPTAQNAYKLAVAMLQEREKFMQAHKSGVKPKMSY